MRINIFGGPGAGKSVTTARVFSELKEQRVSIEHVTEYVKSWVYGKRDVKEFDQIYLFAKQQQYEYRFLSNGVKNIITDCPCFLSVIYANKYISKEIGDAIWKLCEIYDAKYPPYNVFIERGDNDYIKEGRYHDLTEAKGIDDAILEGLDKHYGNIELLKVDYKDKNKILQKIHNHCE